MIQNNRFLHRFHLGFQKSEAGLTLLECLVAIAVISITSALIAPVVVISVATRVQSQTAEQALQVAQGEIDNVRSVVERSGDYTSDDLGIASVTTTTVATDVAAPATTAADYDLTNATVAKTIDVDRDGDPDFAVQTFRTQGRADSDGRPIAFEIGSRVYTYQAVNDNAANLEDPPTGGARLALTSSTGEGMDDQRPVAVLYSRIVKSDETDSLCDYIEYLGGVASTASTTSTGLDCS